MKGQLSIPALERTLGELVRRHEVLRTTFDTVEGQLVQVVRPAEPVTLSLVDLGGLDEGAREQEVRRRSREEVNHPFDLRRGPLLRVSLLRLGDEEHVALFSLHHIVSDGWAIPILVREVTALYQAFVQGLPSPLPELPVQYADYAAWQRQHMHAEALQKQLAFWKKELAPPLPPLELPTDHPRPPLQTYQGSNQTRLLDPALAEEVKRLGRREDATLYMTLLAAFDVLLQHHSAQDDILVGTPFANRSQVELEGLIGCFLNTLVMRADLSGDPTFGELLGRVRETVLGAHAHQDLPFEMLVDELQPERSLNRNPIFQVSFTLENAEPPELSLPGLQVAFLNPGGSTVQFDLVLHAVDTGRGLLAAFQYSTDLFEAGTVARYLSHYELILRRVVARPSVRLSELHAALDEADRLGQAAKEREIEELSFSKLKRARRKSVG